MHMTPLTPPMPFDASVTFDTFKATFDGSNASAASDASNAYIASDASNAYIAFDASAASNASNAFDASDASNASNAFRWNMRESPDVDRMGLFEARTIGIAAGAKVEAAPHRESRKVQTEELAKAMLKSGHCWQEACSAGATRYIQKQKEWWWRREVAKGGAASGRAGKTQAPVRETVAEAHRKRREERSVVGSSKAGGGRQRGGRQATRGRHVPDRKAIIDLVGALRPQGLHATGEERSRITAYNWKDDSTMPKYLRVLKVTSLRLVNLPELY
ncbi:hypothetical protein B0H15DRAFT_928195 [Mycena belliarum]|uniref:Uncharacterized protein n=1 Tax=Mycena belliarum TaxID=1033014 RepID=A0AAD6UCI6_9AGAR|nr:hypothetical protein B0H15DRAFT_928195 [Mycena belliae]